MPTIHQSKSTSSSKAYTTTINVNKGQMVNNQPQPDYNNSSLATQDKVALLAANGAQTVNLKRIRARVHGTVAVAQNIEVYNVVNNGTPTLIATVPVAAGSNPFVNQAITNAISMTNSSSAKLEWQVTPTITDSNAALEVQLDYEVI